MIYSADQIENNKLYGTLMSEINDLYCELGSPSELLPEASRATTGQQLEAFWQADEIGDWGGAEEVIAECANDALEVVFNGLELMGNGGIHCYHQTEDWREFVNRSLELLAEYHAHEAYDNLCQMRDEICLE
jgi:hypothetical protein